MDYVSAFNSAYPQKRCELEFAYRKNGVSHYHVVVDGDRGPRPLTEGELREAARGFRAGK